MTPEQEMIERLETCGAWAEVAWRHSLTKDAAAMIARLVAERDAAREELAQWVEAPRMRIGRTFGIDQAEWQQIIAWYNPDLDYTGPDGYHTLLEAREAWLKAGGSMDGKIAPA